MQNFPFAAKTQSGSTVTGRKKTRGSRVAKPNAAAAAIAEAAENRRKTGKSCHLCVDSDDGPQYDLWHVLFECKRRRTYPMWYRFASHAKHCFPNYAIQLLYGTKPEASVMLLTLEFRMWRLLPQLKL